MMKSFLVFTLLLLPFSLVHSAEEMVNVEKQTAAVEVAEKSIALKTEDQIPLNIEHVKAAAEAPPTPLRLIITGIILAALLTGAYYFVKKYKMSNTINKSNMQIKVISQHYIGPKKSLAIVRVAGESILIGVTDSNISMIKSLALIDDEVPAETPPNFSSALNTLSNEKTTVVKMNHSASSTFGMGPCELEEEFSFSGLKDSVSKKLKSMRSI